MRIARIDVFRVDLPYSGGTYVLSRGREYRSFDATIVRITTDDGLEGWGESTPVGATWVAAHALGVRAGIAEALSLRRRTSVQILLDELVTDSASIVQVVAADAADGIGLKISKAGGLTSARRQRDLCLAAGLTLSVQDTTGSDIAFAAVVYVGQTVPERNLRCVLETPAMVNESTVENPIPLIDGRVMAPDTPGLGVTPRLDLFGSPVATCA